MMKNPKEDEVEVEALAQIEDQTLFHQLEVLRVWNFFHYIIILLQLLRPQATVEEEVLQKANKQFTAVFLCCLVLFEGMHWIWGPKL